MHSSNGSSNDHVYTTGNSSTLDSPGMLTDQLALVQHPTVLHRPMLPG